VATRTRAFGAGNRENHDASEFYARFRAPELSTDDTVNPCEIPDTLVHGDARDMSALADNCVALVVTSPPYFAGKEYEQALGESHVPGTYVEFLAMLGVVFAECRRVLEPGGRMAVNVANLGRKPYRSLSGDVMRILQDDLGLLPRGEVVWQKAKGATGSIAVGSYLSASNPVLRDLTERVVIVSKGRFDRAIPRKEREQRGLPFENTITKEEFFESTVDLWEIRPEHARRVKHPAPFPVELPERLIRLYTYRNDVVLDPFMGSGSTAVAALRNDRRYIGYDTDSAYVDLATARVDDERAALASVAVEPE
jgi:DNA modification methylase